MLNIVLFCVLIILMCLTLVIYMRNSALYIYNTNTLTSSNDGLFIPNDRKVTLGQKSALEVITAICLVLVFSLWCASRPTWVSDSVPYINYFERLDVSSVNKFFSIDGQYRIGFEFIAKLTKVIFGNRFRAFFFVVAFINISVVTIIAFKIEKGRPLQFVTLFIATFGVYYNYIVLRQGLAMSFIILALYYIVKNKKILACLSILIAAIGFHESSIITLILMIPVAFIKKKPKAITLYILLLLSAILYFLKILTPILQAVIKYVIDIGILPSAFNKYVLYLSSGKYYISFLQLFNMLLSAYFVYCAYANDRKKSLKANINNNLVLNGDSDYPLWYYKLLVINVFGQMILGAFSSIVAIIRLADYFLITNVYLFVYDSNYKKKTDNVIYLCLYAIFTMCYIVRIIYHMKV